MTDPIRFDRNTYNLIERLTSAVEKTANELERLNENLEDDS